MYTSQHTHAHILYFVQVIARLSFRV
jgi:hypothetical protein